MQNLQRIKEYMAIQKYFFDCIKQNNECISLLKNNKMFFYFKKDFVVSSKNLLELISIYEKKINQLNQIK